MLTRNDRNELKHLNRRELIDIIYQQKKSEQELQAENEQLRKQLETKRIALSKAGSVAEAALALTDIFSTAQASADIYLAEIEQRRNDIEREYNLLTEDARKEADNTVGKAAEQQDAIITEARRAKSILKRYGAAIEQKRESLHCTTPGRSNL